LTNNAKKDLRESLARFNLPICNPQWGRIQRGIEKESLRVTSQGRLAQTDHPAGLGSALTHPYVTTDYSEALLELITPVCGSARECLEFLTDLHTFSYSQLPADERLWVSSMPCIVESEEEIPLARYGSSNTGQLKTLYREGLGHRYGRLMQTIAGIHYNFSMPESFWPEYRRIRGSEEDLQTFQTNQYLHLIRNFHRFSWMLPYLFGASPAVCKCFTRGREHDLQPLGESTLYKPYATALRMGNLGYKSDAQRSIFVCYNDLDNYLDSLRNALLTTYPAYQEIGLHKDGRHLQLNTNLLQLENEFYGTIRPKRVGSAGERPLQLLREHGIQYIEVRVLDLNPFLPLGIDEEQINFLDTFLLFCLLAESPACDRASYYENGENLARVVNEGRRPDLQLSRQGEPVSMKTWAENILGEVMYAANLLDHLNATSCYSRSTAAQFSKLANPELTPSARVLAALQDGDRSFCSMTMEQSAEHEAWFRANKLDPQRLAALQEASAASLQRQAAMEQEDNIDFEEYLRQWNATAG